MAKAILGIKLGMTQTFDEAGVRVPLTVVEAGPCVVVRKRTAAKHGYDAIQVGFVKTAERKLTKPVLGQMKDVQAAGPFRFLREFRVEDPDAYEIGQEIKVDLFAKGDRVDVTGISRGKGFQGSIRRHHFDRGPMTHGSKNKRQPGSVGQSAFPSHTFKGKRLPGHMGARRVTVQRLTVFGVDAEKNLLFIAGPVPGGTEELIEVRATVKAKRAKAE